MLGLNGIGDARESHAGVEDATRQQRARAMDWERRGRFGVKKKGGGQDSTSRSSRGRLHASTALGRRQARQWRGDWIETERALWQAQEQERASDEVARLKVSKAEGARGVRNGEGMMCKSQEETGRLDSAKVRFATGCECVKTLVEVWVSVQKTQPKLLRLLQAVGRPA